MQIRAAFCRILGCALGAAGIAFSCACPRAAIASESIPSETCPSREAIDAAVTALLGKSLVSSEDMKLVDVMDLGERYVITVKGRTREYSDELRDCAKRARVAAVFVALTLAPPDIASTEAPPQSEFQAAEPPPAPPASPAPAATARARQPSPPQPPEPLASSTVWFPAIEIGARGALAPRSDKSVLDLGGEFRLILTTRRWGMTLGADIPISSTLELESIRVRQTRYSADLGLRYNLHSAAVRVAFDFGALVGIVRLQQVDGLSTSKVSRVEAGLRTGADLALEGRAVSPYVGGFVELLPVTSPVAVEPRGSIGRTSAVWIGLVVGITLGSY